MIEREFRCITTTVSGGKLITVTFRLSAKCMECKIVSLRKLNEQEPKSCLLMLPYTPNMCRCYIFTTVYTITPDCRQTKELYAAYRPAMKRTMPRRQGFETSANLHSALLSGCAPAQLPRSLEWCRVLVLPALVEVQCSCSLW